MSRQHFVRRGDRELRAGRQSGFNLIELMVAMTIGLLMVTAILKLFLDVTRTNDEMAKTNAQIENGRFALQLMSNDLLHAGFWDGYIPDYDDLTASAAPAGYPASYTEPDPCLAYGSWSTSYRENMLRMPVQTFDAVPAGCAGVITDHKAGTEILVVRYADTKVTLAGDRDAAKVYFQTTYCAADSPYAFVLAKTDFDLTEKDCLAEAATRELISHIYWITSGETLMRAKFVGGASDWQVQPLIDGIEHFVIELGVDNVGDGGAVDYNEAVAWVDPLNKVSPANRGDGAPDEFCEAGSCTEDDLINAVSAKLYLIARSPEPSQGYSDSKAYTLGTKSFTPTGDALRFKRHLYSSSVRLTNVSGRRETP